MPEPVEILVQPRAVRDDGSVPFVAPQRGVTPTAADHLATKAYVDGTPGGGVTAHADLTGLSADEDLLVGRAGERSGVKAESRTECPVEARFSRALTAAAGPGIVARWVPGGPGCWLFRLFRKWSREIVAVLPAGGRSRVVLTKP